MTESTSNPTNNNRRFYVGLVIILVIVNAIFILNALNSQPQLTDAETQGYELAGQAVDYFDNGDYGQAITAYSDALVYLPDDAGLYYNRALAFLALDDHPQAIADLTQAIAQDAEFAPSYLVLGDIYDDDGNVLGALEAYQQYVALVGNGGRDAPRIVLRIDELEDELGTTK